MTRVQKGDDEGTKDEAFAMTRTKRGRGTRNGEGTKDENLVMMRPKRRVADLAMTIPKGVGRPRDKR